MIQPLAFVHPQAQLADNVVVEPFTTIAKDVKIGEGTWIGPNVTIMEGARIGKNCKIFPGAVISAVPQDLKYKGEKSKVEIGDNVTIREFVTVNRGTAHAMKTVIGDNTLIMAYAHVAHDCVIGKNCIIANSVNLAGHVEIQDWVIIGGAVNIQQFTRIGEHAFISGSTSINKDVPPYVKGARFPFSYVGVNSIGLRRRGFTQDQINHILDIYRVLFVKGLNTTNALNVIENEFPATPERDNIMSFIRHSVIGIMKGFRKATNEN